MGIFFDMLGGTKPTIHPDVAHELQQSVKFGDLMGRLAANPEFQMLDAALKERYHALVGQLKECKAEQLSKLQGQIQELEKAIEIVPNAISAGAEARQELERNNGTE